MLNKTGCYIHIPFCDHKCIYCDFYSITTDRDKLDYLSALSREIENYALTFGKDRIIKSIYFGGGTPSYMTADYIGSIIQKIENNFLIDDFPEITLETNPGTAEINKLREFRKVGINRISIGIQSFDNDELKFLTRIHDSELAVQTVKEANKAGFENISIDLIFNLPGQTKTKWINNLKTAVLLPINHISAYSLILERGTILNKMVLDKKVNIQGEEIDAELYESTIDFLTLNNFVQYEVSNFAKPGFECKHNNLYWTHKEYFGFGCSAHSFIERKRWWNYSNIRLYIDSIIEKGNAVKNNEILTLPEMMEEHLLLHLRGRGLDIAEFNSKYGSEFWQRKNSYIRSLIKNKYLFELDNFIRMTKKGYLLCDEILAELIS